MSEYPDMHCGICEDKQSVIIELNDELTALRARVDELEKHDCERWRDEGIGCSICGTLVHHSLEDAKELQDHANWLVSDLKTRIADLERENAELKYPLDPRWSVKRAAYEKTLQITEATRLCDNTGTPEDESYNQALSDVYRNIKFEMEKGGAE